MILPNKHIRLSESLYGLGSFVAANLKTPKTLEEIWIDFEEAVTKHDYPFAHPFENIILAVDLLHMIGIIDLDTTGRIQLCNSSN